jgi:hypothetical protein
MSSSSYSWIQHQQPISSPLMTGFGVSSLESEESDLEELVAEALSLDDEEAWAELDALGNESAAAAQNVVASSALT